MSFYKMGRPDKADTQFSVYIRIRDGKCLRCNIPGYGPKGIHGLECSHYFPREKESTRFDTENCDTLCKKCHFDWEEKKENKKTGELYEYGRWKAKRMGAAAFTRLRFRAFQYQKKDRKMSLIVVQHMMKILMDGRQGGVIGAKA